MALLLSSVGTLPSIFGVANVAGTSVSGEVAPMEAVAIYGYNLGPATPLVAQASGGLVGTSPGGYQVTFDGIAVPLLYGGPEQINAVIPSAVGTQGNTSMAVVVPHGSAGATLFLTPAQPAIVQDFSTGYAAALNDDGSVNSASNPAAAGSVMAVWATGAGAVYGPIDGTVIDPGQTATPDLPISVLWSRFLAYNESVSTSTEVLYAGGSAGTVNGVLQINSRLPQILPTYFLAMPYVSLQAGSKMSPGMMIHVTP